MKTKHNPSHGLDGSLTISEPHLGVGQIVAVFWAVALLGDAATAATVIDTQEESQESMMTAISANMMFVTSVIPTDTLSSLEFTSSLDMSAKTFSYSTLLGQMYGGLPFSLQVSGTFDLMSHYCSWTTTGQIGIDAWAGFGGITWKDEVDGKAGDITTIDHIKGESTTVTGRVTLEKDTFGTVNSKGAFVITNNKTGKISNHTGTDFYDKNEKRWVIRDWTLVPKFSYTQTNGIGPDDFGNGTFIVTVPEPSYGALSGVLALVFALTRRKRSSDGQ